METVRIETDVCVVGGGPAGLAAALLLLQAGHRVTVLERHANFDREYRGEVLTPRFIQMMKMLGLLDYIESQKHLKLEDLEVFYRNWKVASLSFAKIAPDAPYALWMPQPILLNAMNEKARSFPGYSIYFSAPVTGLLKESGKTVGAVAAQKEACLEVRAKVTIGADGRSSAVSRLGDFQHEYDEHELDILWFSILRPKDYGSTLRGFFSPKRNYLILPKYPDLLQCGLIVRPGEYQHFLREGIDSLRSELLSAHPMVHDFAAGLKSFKPFVLLQARVHLVKEWAQDGCVLIGDAAHTCSPAGAVGVSVAVETAITAAKVISKGIRSGDVSREALGEIQKRREEDVRDIQKLQRQFARGVVLAPPSLAWLTATVLFLASKTPLFRALQKRLMTLSSTGRRAIQSAD